MRRFAAIIPTTLAAVAVVSFIGCSETQQLPPSTTAATAALRSQRSMSNSARSIANAAVAYVGNETMGGKQTGYTWQCLSGNKEVVSFNAAGNASGSYSGTFTAAGSFKPFGFKCATYGEASFYETFSITSGSNLMNGTLAGNVRFTCIPGSFQPQCNVSGSAQYRAGLYRNGKLRKSFSGTATVTTAGYDGVNETLEAL